MGKLVMGDNMQRKNNNKEDKLDYDNHIVEYDNEYPDASNAQE